MNKLYVDRYNRSSFVQRVITQWNTGSTLSRAHKRLVNSRLGMDNHTLTELVTLWRRIRKQCKGCASIGFKARKSNHHGDAWYKTWKSNEQLKELIRVGNCK